jgi:hypothetical protein
MTTNSIRALALAVVTAFVAPVVVTVERQAIEEPWPMLFQQAAIDPDVAALQYRARANLDRLMQPVASVTHPVDEI